VLEILKDSPWLIIVVLALLVPILGVVFGTITSYLKTVKLAEIEAGLKQDMLQRGMSADDIKKVIEATSKAAADAEKAEAA
jgi:surface antigen